MSPYSHYHKHNTQLQAKKWFCFQDNCRKRQNQNYKIPGTTQAELLLVEISNNKVKFCLSKSGEMVKLTSL